MAANSEVPALHEFWEDHMGVGNNIHEICYEHVLHLICTCMCFVLSWFFRLWYSVLFRYMYVNAGRCLHVHYLTFGRQ